MIKVSQMRKGDIVRIPAKWKGCEAGLIVSEKQINSDGVEYFWVFSNSRKRIQTFEAVMIKDFFSEAEKQSRKQKLVDGYRRYGNNVRK